MGIDVVKRASRQRLFGNMLHEFTTVAEGIHFPTEPTLKKARLEMAIKAIDRIKEKDLKFKAELEEMDRLGSHITDKLDKCQETADILRTHLLQCFHKKRREIKRREADKRLCWLEETHRYFEQLEEEFDSM